MSEKRYFKVEYDEEWYLFDSATISEQLVKEQAEYGYGVFANSLSPSEIVGLLNELSEENEQLRTQLLICQQSKSDDGQVKIWQVPPIKEGMRITSFTTSDGEIDE